MFGIYGVNTISITIIQIIREKYDNEYITFIDDDPQKINRYFNGIKVSTDCDSWKETVKNGQNHQMAISLGEKYLEKKFELFHTFNRFQNVSFPVIKHNSCIISELAKIDDGNILNFGVIVGHNTHLKSNSVFWSGVVIEHDSIIGESCYLAPNVTISGFVNIGDCSLIGSGAVVLPEINIGKNCIIGAGAVVTKNIPENSVAVGVPAKIIRKCH